MSNGPEFGKSINREDADAFYRNARRIEARNVKSFENMFKDDPESAEYYLKPCLGYIFRKDKLEALLAKMTEAEKDYLVLLNGAKTGRSGNGQRTLIAMVYKKDSDELLHLDTGPIALSQEDIGTQHPGILEEGGQDEIPDTISNDQIGTNP